MLTIPLLAAAQTPAPATPQPIPLGFDGQLASWFQVRGEFRTRIEGFTGGGFADNEDAYWMDRFRLNATVRPSKSLAFVVQAHDARAFDKTAELAGGAVPRHARSADGVRRNRCEAHPSNRTAGAGVRRAAVDRPSRVGQHRPIVRRSAGHVQNRIRADRCVFGVGRDDRPQRLRQERQRQSDFRRVRLADHGDPEAGDRAVFLLAAVSRLHSGTGRPRRSPSGDDGPPHGRKAARQPWIIRAKSSSRADRSDPTM